MDEVKADFTMWLKQQNVTLCNQDITMGIQITQCIKHPESLSISRVFPSVRCIEKSPSQLLQCWTWSVSFSKLNRYRHSLDSAFLIPVKAIVEMIIVGSVRLVICRCLTWITLQFVYFVTGINLRKSWKMQGLLHCNKLVWFFSTEKMPQSGTFWMRTHQ